MRASRAIILIALSLWVGGGLAGAQVAVLGSLARAAVVAPGQRISGTVLVRNNQAGECEVRVYQTDYLTCAQGTVEYGKPCTHPRSNAAWISFTPHQFTLAGGATAPVDYEVRVPPQVELPGTYWSMLMIEPQAKGTEAATAPNEGQMTVRTVIRYAVQISTQIGDTGTCELKLDDRQIVNDGRGPCLQLDLKNSGERLLAPRVWADIYDAQGALVRRSPEQQVRVYPGCSSRVSLPLGPLLKGHHSVLIVADNGDDHVFGARLRFDIP